MRQHVWFCLTFFTGYLLTTDALAQTKAERIEDLMAHYYALGRRHGAVLVAHAGYPLLEDLLAVLYSHPHVYVDIGDIASSEPRPGFYLYLQRIVEAGFGNRVMFGSDQMVWPEVIERAIAVIEEAPFLREEQKRDILYNNAARFLSLSEEQIAIHHGK